MDLATLKKQSQLSAWVLLYLVASGGRRVHFATGRRRIARALGLSTLKPVTQAMKALKAAKLLRYAARQRTGVDGQPQGKFLQVTLNVERLAEAGIVIGKGAFDAQPTTDVPQLRGSADAPSSLKRGNAESRSVLDSGSVPSVDRVGLKQRLAAITDPPGPSPKG